MWLRDGRQCRVEETVPLAETEQAKRMPGACTAVGHDVGESDVGKAVGEDVVGPRKVGARVGARVTADSERRARMAAGVGPMAFFSQAYFALAGASSKMLLLAYFAVAGASSKMAAEPLSQSVQPKMLQPSLQLKMRGNVCNNGVAWHAHRQALAQVRPPKKCDHNPNHYICEPDPRKASENNAGPGHITLLRCRHLCGPPKVSATRAEEIRSHLKSKTRSRAFSRRR